MDSAVRHLRDGVLPDAATCATCCIFDNLSVIGGSLVLQHAVRSFIAAMRQGRSQATVVRLVDVTGALTPLAAEAAASTPRSARAGSPDVEYIDLHSDPWGWHRATAAAAAAAAAPGAQGVEEAAAGPGPGSASAALAASAAGAGQGPLVSLDELCSLLQRPAASQAGPGAGMAAAGTGAPAAEAMAQALTGAPASGRGGGGVCVVLGCLSSLVERYGGSSSSSSYGGGDTSSGGGEWTALALVEALQRAPAVSCVLAAVHTDLLSEAALEGSGRGQQLGGGALAGRLDCRTRRRTGRVKVESELYSISLQPPAPGANPAATAATAAATAPAPAPAVHFFAMPPQVDAPDPRALLRLQPPAPSSAVASATAGSATAGAVTAAPAAGAAGAGASAGPGGAGGGGGGGQPLGLMGGVGSAEELARAVGSSMRLTLTEEERRAKQAVVLPYQHTGTGLRGPAAAAYAAGDHAGYLPPAAGGRGPGAGTGAGAGAAGGGGEAAGGGGGGGQRGLGHILYVRDSASEQDSDQDLDEDLLCRHVVSIAPR